jgi:hypothetical protein
MKVLATGQISGLVSHLADISNQQEVNKGCSSTNRDGGTSRSFITGLIDRKH